MSDDDFIVTMRDVRAAEMCSRASQMLRSRAGARLAAAHGLDWKEFCENGLPASKLEATGNALILQVVEVARERRR